MFTGASSPKAVKTKAKDIWNAAKVQAKPPAKATVLDNYRKRNPLKEEARLSHFVLRLPRVAANMCDEGDASFVEGA